MKITTALAAGTGNLFDDAHFKKGLGARFKAHIAKRVTAQLDAASLTVPEAARQAQCTQADIRRIRKGDVKSYSVQELVDLARCFGLRVNVSIDLPRSASRSLH